MAEKQLTTKQQSFLDNLTRCGGDVKEAADLQDMQMVHTML